MNDVVHGLARADLKVRLMYSLAVAPARGRRLVLAPADDAYGGMVDWWRGETTMQDAGSFAAGAKLAFDDGALDAIVLHRAVDAMAAAPGTFSAAALFSECARTLAPNGLVAGCFENRSSLDYLARDARALFGGPRTPPRPLSVAACARALTAAGFTDVRLFNALYDADNPTQLQSIEPRFSRRSSLRMIHAFRPPALGRARYLLWQCLAHAGAAQFFGATTFFFAHKPC